ncbi:MAG: SPFH domain-containing protein [Fimbriimonadaceae bacterium]
MSLWDKIKGEFIDIVNWTDDTQDTMVYRFERYGNQLKMGAQLTVRESQAAVFVNEGHIADVFAPGMYTLETQNMPILSTLKGWKFGFNSPFVAEVYFVNTKRFTNQKWGTMNPLMMRDPDFGMVRVRAFGSYEMRVTDPAKFLKEIVGTDGDFTADEISEQIRNHIVSNFSSALAEMKVPVLDLVAHYQTLGSAINQKIGAALSEYGIELSNLLIENVSVPPEVEAAIDRRSSMGAVGDLNAYTQFQAATSMEKAAENPSGMGAAGMSMGLGMAMAGALNQAQQAGAAAPAPPPIPQEVAFHVAVNGQQAGPYNMSTLAQMAAGGQLAKDTLVWKAGMATWTAAGDVPEFATIFGAVPPPLPPQ